MSPLPSAARAERPNVIVILTDDQGYGEIAAHGNPDIVTPSMDQLYRESVRLTDFHVDPTCSPTRAALLTGRYSTRAGVWHTINGRSLLPPEELTMAEVFRANGYATAMIGKWHLGDSYPCRPQDQGFEHAVWHRGGGIGNAGDAWGNDYFDDTYEVNGTLQPFEGYCTDVWFREATRFVENHRTKPFFLYLATNAPHGPYRVPEEYARPYLEKGLPPTMARFYGMIANIDENLGRFRARLAEWDLAENTLLVFMTDNGTTAGWIDRDAGYEYFNAGMRGWKGSEWDGGHRVPCYWHWPLGGLNAGRDVDTLTAHFDLLPTLVELAGLEKPPGPEWDGRSLAGILRDPAAVFPDRTLFAHVQRAFTPPKWERSVAMTERWRLVNGQQLYDIEADPAQQMDLAREHPREVESLRDAYETWWRSLEEARQRTVRLVIGGKQNPTTLSSHDWLMPGTQPAAWHQSHVEQGALINGAWAIDIAEPGRYRIRLYRWPPPLERKTDCRRARLQVGDLEQSMELATDATAAEFTVQLAAGPTMLQTWLQQDDGKEHGAYYVTVERLREP